MHRTQIIIEDWQYEHLRIMAEENGKSENSGGSLDVLCGLGEDHEAAGEDHDRFFYKKVTSRD